MQAIITTISNFLGKLFTFLQSIFLWFKGLFTDFMAFILDFPLKILQGFLDGTIYLLSKIPAPEFLTKYSMSVLFAQLPDGVSYFVGLFGIPAALAVLGLGVAFRLTRKALTLGQW